MFSSLCGGVAQVVAKREHLKAAESKLLKLALQRNSAAAASGATTAATAAAPVIRAVDTEIPPSNIPLNTKEQQSQLAIHSIEVTNELKQQTEEELPLVLLHGYMNGGAYFYRNILGLSQYFRKIHSLDMLGWGLSSRPKFIPAADDIESTQDFFVESLESWRRAQDIDRMILAGHSMGGYLSVAYTEKYPERVERLVLISPVGVPSETPEEQKQRAAIRKSSWRGRLMYGTYESLFPRYTGGDVLRMVSEQRGRRWIESYVTKRLPAINDPEEQQTLTDYLYHNITLPGSGEYCLANLLKPTVLAKEPLLHRIPKLDVKYCSFIYGADDWMDSSGGLQVEQLCRDKPDSPSVCVYEVEKAGHLLMLENSADFNRGLVQAALGISIPDSPARLEAPSGPFVVRTGPAAPGDNVPDTEMAV